MTSNVDLKPIKGYNEYTTSVLDHASIHTSPPVHDRCLDSLASSIYFIPMGGALLHAMAW